MRSLFNSLSGYLGHAHQQQHRHVVVGVGEEVHGLHHHLPQHKVLIVTSFHFILLCTLCTYLIFTHRQERVPEECGGGRSGEVHEVLDAGPGVAGHVDDPPHAGGAQLPHRLHRDTRPRGV